MLTLHYSLISSTFSSRLLSSELFTHAIGNFQNVSGWLAPFLLLFVVGDFNFNLFQNKSFLKVTDSSFAIASFSKKSFV